MSSVRYVYIIIGLSVMGVIAIIFIATFRPDSDNTIALTSIVGFLTPTIGTILALMIKDIHKDINSRMTQLIETTEKAAHAEGKLEGTRSKR